MVDTGQHFQPSDEYLENFLDTLSTLSERSKAKLVREMTYDEVEQIVKDCPTGRSPGLDGLPYEFYKTTWDVIGEDFTKVIKTQLNNLTLIESGKHGVTALPSKVSGVPFVTDLRPLTLLCCDYRILSKGVNGRLHPVMGEVVESSQLATGEKSKNILTGVYDIIATVDFVNRFNKPAYIASYDLVKAYDRASISFLMLVMERMDFPVMFRRWVEMLHKNATTRLKLSTGISRVIPVTFSFRQGDPIALDLYSLQQEPLLRLLRRTLHGIPITNFTQKDVEYCDDIEVVSNDVQDLVKFDEIMNMFEATSGAILSRNEKSKVLGIGSWKNKADWPQEVSWLKTEKQLKIFGFIICPTYQETVKNTWEKVIIGFEKVLYSWSSRTLNTLCQRVEVAKMFALSKLYYVAQVLPLPVKYRKRVEKNLSQFIFKGRHERMKLSEIENSPDQGGLGLPNIGIKSDCLLLKQMCRMLTLPNEKSFHFLGYWLGGFLRETGWGVNFPQLSEIGPVSHKMSNNFPIHQYMLDTFLEALGRGELNGNNMQAITTKEMYMSRMDDLLTPPKVELKFPLINFPELVYPRIKHSMLEVKQRDVLFSLVHNMYPNRQRLFQQRRTDDAVCQNPACKREALVQDIEHIFCSCYKVRSAWQWTRNKILELVTELGPPLVVSNIDIILAMFPTCRQEVECIFILGTYVELVDKEVVSGQKDLLLDTLKGVLRAKTEFVRKRAVPGVGFII